MRKILIATLAFVSIALIFAIVNYAPDVSPLKTHSLTLQRIDPKTGSFLNVKIGPENPDWVPLNKVSQFFLNAIVVSEDSRFYQHMGVDFREIWESFQTNMEQSRYARGASTITQQVVRIAFLSREKTLTRKVREVLGAFALEWTLSKDEILEWYINLIPLGSTRYGVREASNFYFKTEPELLNINQSILLAMIVPAPSVWTPGLLKKKLSEAGQKRFSKIANALFSEGYITSIQLQKALASGNFGAPILVESTL